MNRGLWIARKNYLLTLIKRLSDGHGGDDAQWLAEHSKSVIELHPDERIEEAIACYQGQIAQLHCYPERGLR